MNWLLFTNKINIQNLNNFHIMMNPILKFRKKLKQKKRQQRKDAQYKQKVQRRIQDEKDLDEERRKQIQKELEEEEKERQLLEDEDEQEQEYNEMEQYQREMQSQISNKNNNAAAEQELMMKQQEIIMRNQIDLNFHQPEQKQKQVGEIWIPTIENKQTKKEVKTEEKQEQIVETQLNSQPFTNFHRVPLQKEQKDQMKILKQNQKRHIIFRNKIEQDKIDDEGQLNPEQRRLVEEIKQIKRQMNEKKQFSGTSQILQQLNQLKKKEFNQKESDDEEEDDEQDQVEKKLKQNPDLIKIPGYQQLFSKQEIQRNIAQVDPFLSLDKDKESSNTKVIAQKNATYNIPQSQMVNHQQQSANSNFDKSSFVQTKGKEIYKNQQGFIITDEVLKILGNPKNPEKIKIGNISKYAQQNQQQQQLQRNLPQIQIKPQNQTQENIEVQNSQDPFVRATLQMNYNFLKDLGQKNQPTDQELKQLELKQQQLQEEAKKQQEKQIFIRDRQDQQKNQLDQKITTNPVIIREATVKKSKIDLTTSQRTFIPPQLLRTNQAVQQKQIENPLSNAPSVASSIQIKQNKFKQLIEEKALQPQISKDAQKQLDAFFNEINSLK